MSRKDSEMRIVLILVLAAILVAGCVGSGAASPDPSEQPSSSPQTTVDPTTSPTPTPTPSAALPSPSPSPARSPATALVAWTPIGSIEWEAGTYDARGVVGFAGGYVAIVGGLLHSTDGRTWQAVDLPGPDPVTAPPSVEWQAEGAVPVAVATDGRTVVAVGTYDHAPCDWERATSGDTGGSPVCPASPISWASTDGLHWRSSLPWVGPTGLPAENFTSGSAFSAVWATQDGWEAWLCYPSGSVCATRELWASSDGLAWARRSEMPDIQGEWGPPLTIVGAGGLRLAASSGFMRRSADGISWRDVAFPADPGYLQAGVGPASAGDPWVLSSAVDGPTIWRSTDLAAWQQVRLPDAARIDGGSSSVIRSSSGYIAVARAWPIWVGTTVTTTGMTWLSRDGTDWVSVAGALVIGPLTDGPQGVIGLGLYAEDGSLPVFILR